MDIVQQIESLIARRRDLEREIQQIDNQLERVRVTLGSPVAAFREPQSQTRPTRAEVQEQHGQTAHAILAALAVREPQTVKMLKSCSDTTTIPQICAQMSASGQLVRQRIGGNIYWYARTQEPLDRLADRMGEFTGAESEEGSAEEG